MKADHIPYHDLYEDTLSTVEDFTQEGKIKI